MKGLIGIALLVPLCGCGNSDDPPVNASSVVEHDRFDDLKRVLGNDVANAETVEAFRIHPPADDLLGTGGKWETWPASKGPVPVDTKLSDDLSRLLLNPSSTSPNVKPCTLMPGVKYRFSRGASESEVYLCFECLMLGGLEGGKWTWVDFSPASRAFAGITKQVFPDDSVIQKLK